MHYLSAGGAYQRAIRDNLNTATALLNCPLTEATGGLLKSNLNFIDRLVPIRAGSNVTSPLFALFRSGKKKNFGFRIG